MAWGDSVNYCQNILL